jgi:hypothetical protein
MVLYEIMITQMIDPKAIQDAISVPDRKFWKSGMQEEYDSVMENEIEKLVDRLSNQKTVKKQVETQLDPSQQLMASDLVGDMKLTTILAICKGLGSQVIRLRGNVKNKVVIFIMICFYLCYFWPLPIRPLTVDFHVWLM